MRRRLTISILAVVVGTLLVTGVGTFLLEQQAASSTAEQDLTVTAQATSKVLSSTNASVTPSTLSLLQKVSGAATLDIIGLGPRGTFEEPLPSSLNQAIMDVPALQDTRSVAGNVGRTVFVAVPLTNLIGDGIRT